VSQMHTGLVSVAEFSTATRLKEVTIRAWLAQKRIAKVKLGRRILIPASEIDRLISQNFTPAQPAQA
jgi:excisionase family DNA binding protein